MCKTFKQNAQVLYCSIVVLSVKCNFKGNKFNLLTLPSTKKKKSYYVI